MDVLNQFLNNISHHFNKGYPDIKNNQDVVRIFTLLEQYGIPINEMKKPFEFLSDKAQLAGTQLMQDLDLPQDEIKAHSKNRIILLTDIPRQEIFSKLEQLGWEKDITISGSSTGGYRKDGIEVIHKPKSLTAVGGAGIENETIFVDNINKYVEESLEDTITAKLISEVGDDVVFNDVSECISVGKEGEKKGWKGDAVIKGQTDHAISIKKDGPFRWASVMTDFKEFYIDFLTKASQNQIPNLKLQPDPQNAKVLQMWDPVNQKPYGRIFVTNVPKLNDEDYLYDQIFGKDDAIVVQRTFSDNDFTFDENTNTLEIKSSKTITSLDQVDKSELPILEFERNASKATKLEGIMGRGIIVRLSPIERMEKASSKANNLIVDYSTI